MALYILQFYSLVALWCTLSIFVNSPDAIYFFLPVKSIHSDPILVINIIASLLIIFITTLNKT